MPTLLVIDDDESVRTALQIVFTRLGYTVMAAADGPEGLTFFRAHLVDAALVDVHMPGMNGIEVCRELHGQAQIAGRKLSVWLMTGAATDEIVRLGLEAGAVAVLKKPFNSDHLARDMARRVG